MVSFIKLIMALLFSDGFLGHVYKDTWHSAKVRCKGGLLTPTNLTERSVVDLIKQEKFRTMWIDVTRQQFHNLQWPDGSANTMPGSKLLVKYCEKAKHIVIL